MAELITVNSKGKVFMHPEALKLTTYLGKLKSEDLKYIHLAYDYKGMYERFPLSVRKLKAKARVYGELPYVPEEDKKLIPAIEEYQSLQYDSEREIEENYKNKIAALNAMFSIEVEPAKMTQIMKTIELIAVNLKKIQQQIYAANEIRKLKGDGKLSLAEIWQLNMLKSKQNKIFEAEHSGIETIEE